MGQKPPFDGLRAASYLLRMRHNAPRTPLGGILVLACLVAGGAYAQDITPPELRGGRGGELPGLPQPDAASPAPQQQDKAEAAVPQTKDGMLGELYAHLAQAPDAMRAGPIAETIEELWLQSDSPTIGVLMGRSLKALQEERQELALQFLDAVVELAPDYAEGWNRRAYLLYLQDDYERALGDLRRALALEPNHFKALEGLARILREIGQKKNALQAYEQLLRIHPHVSGGREAVEELTVEVEGQGI